jgi:hypothetical protein
MLLPTTSALLLITTLFDCCKANQIGEVVTTERRVPRDDGTWHTDMPNSHLKPTSQSTDHFSSIYIALPAASSGLGYTSSSDISDRPIQTSAW